MNKKIKEYIDNSIKVNLKNKNVFITGANSGIGFELAKECAYLGANIFMLSRNIDKAQKAKDEILNEYSNSKIEIIELDLASLESIKKCASDVKKHDVDVFINNAGVYHLDKSYTKDNFEIVMGTNLIGTLALNDLLMDYFNKLNHKVDVIFETSITSKISKIDYNDFFMNEHYNKMKIYARSKVGVNNIFFNYKDEYKDSNINFKLVHPGVSYTPIIKKGYKNKAFEYIASLFMKLVFHKPDKAALSILYSLNEYVDMSGPRGLFEISGYPKKVKFNKDAEYKECITYVRNLIKNKRTL